MYRTIFSPISFLYYEYLENHKTHNMNELQYHNCYEVYLMTEGERYLFSHDKCHILKPGDLFIVQPFEMHYTQSLDAPFYARHLVHFTRKHLEGLLTPPECDLLLGKLKSCIIHLTPEQYQEACLFFQRINAYSAPSSIFSGKLQYSYLLHLLVFLSECIESAELLISETPIPGVRTEILNAIQYINQHYMEEISLDFIADYVHLSKYYFCRQFPKIAGATFLEYVHNVRLAQVHQLLIGTKLTITEIAAQTGFSSGVQLSRAFYAIYQMTPSAFRKQYAVKEK